MVNFGFPSSGGSQSRVCCRRDFELITTLFTIFRSGPWSHNIYFSDFVFVRCVTQINFNAWAFTTKKWWFVLWNGYLLGSLIKCTQSKLLFCILKRAFNWIWQQVRIVGFALAFEILEKLYLPSLLLSPISIFSFCHLFFSYLPSLLLSSISIFFIFIRIRVMFSKHVCYDFQPTPKMPWNRVLWVMNRVY